MRHSVKISLMAFVAMFSFCTMASAQLKTFECELFSCQYPANFEAQEQWMDEAFNAKIEDGIEFFSVSVNDQDMTTEELKEYGEGMKGLIERSFGEPTGWTAGPLEIKGKQLIIRCEGEEEVDDDVKVPAIKYSFCVVKPNKKTFVGELEFPKKDEATYKPLLTKIIASFKAK